MWSDHTDPFKDFPGDHAVFHLGPANHAEYFVGAHRAGLVVCGASPLVRICRDHLFSKWPGYLFKKLDEKYRRAAEELRGPDVGVSLPIMTALLLSRAESRNKIQEALRDLREEYSGARDKLWEMLREMWTGPDFKAQMKVLQKIQGAADAMFEASFPEMSSIHWDALSG